VSLWRGVKPTIPAPRALTIDKAFVRDVLCIDARPLNLESCIWWKRDTERTVYSCSFSLVLAISTRSLHKAMKSAV